MMVCSLLVAALAFVALWFKAQPTVATSAKEKAGSTGRPIPAPKKPAPAPPSEKPSEPAAPSEEPKAPEGGDDKKDEGPAQQTIRDAANGGWYLQVNQGGQEDGTQVGQNPRWTADEFGRNQWWIIHHYPENNTVALEESGKLSPQQKWRLVEAADGRTRIVNTANNECLTDMQNDKGAITWQCTDEPDERQDWKISDGP
ncbi:RICIN domain-containing protein [Streptomyces sp. NPDC048434]|uniref:RICIN domain-containing protein n=1 Tax=Streptomyces sp. NPDC048434 TaxID=3365549 RepID=UPI0037220B18